MTKAELAARNIARQEKDRQSDINEVIQAFSQKLLKELNHKYVGDPYKIYYWCGERLNIDYVRLPSYWSELEAYILPPVINILKDNGWLVSYAKREQTGKTPEYMSTVVLTIIADPEYKEPVTPLSLLERVEAWLKKCLHSKNS